MTTSTDIHAEVLKRLDADFRWKKKGGTWLSGGRCPDCKKNEVYTHAVTPRVVKCGRQNSCGYERSVRELYPEIFDSWSNRYQASEAEPNAAADAYLAHARGLDLRGLRGAYAQETYRCQTTNRVSATVRFPLPGGGWWERLIDQPGRFDRKARFCPGKTVKGQWWQRPDVSFAALAAGDTIWIVEGIFDALALEQAGQRAVSIMSAYFYPEDALRQLRIAIAEGPTPQKSPKLIWALDLGGTGTRYIREYVKRAREEGWTCGAAQTREEGEDGQKLDWNDCLIRDRLDAGRRADYLWNGEVLIAPTATDKAHLIWERHRLASFHFTFGTETYWASIDAGEVEERVDAYRQATRGKELKEPDPAREAEIREQAAREALRIEKIANVTFRALYRQRDDATDETAYFLQVDFPAGSSRGRPSTKGAFSAAALTTAAEFKKRLFAIGTGAIWTGSQYHLDRIMQRQTPRIADVQPLAFTGYDRDSESYVFGEIAVRKGRVYKPNEEAYFELGDVALKLGTSERLLDIDYDAEALDTSWLSDLWTAYGAKGIVVLTFWFASLFAEQVRRDQKSFPFLEMFGLPGTGKTTLVEFLWKLFGRENYEGFDPAKATPAAIARNLGKVGNLPVVLIEGDRRDEASHARKFEWEELKTAYNGRSVRSRGVKNGGMETFEPPFRGAIVIEQNEPVSASRAILERIMSLGFDMTGWSDDTKEAAQRLEQWPIEKVSGFIIHAVRREADILTCFRQAFGRYEHALLGLPEIRTNRLAKTHGQLLAFLDALRLILPSLTREQHAQTAQLIRDMACQRQLAVSAEHPDVALFWERYDFLEELEGADSSHPINHHRDPGLIAVRLGEFEQRCADRRLTIPAHTDLLRHLKTSKSRPFVGVGSVNSRTGKSVHCWIFRRPGGEPRGAA